MNRIALVLILISFIGIEVNAKGNSKPNDKLPVAQSVLSGKIIDKQSGEELTGVTVRLNGTDQLCYTDFEGNFQFKNLVAGEYKIDVELISYTTIKNCKIEVGSNEVNELNINLEQKK